MSVRKQEILKRLGSRTNENYYESSLEGINSAASGETVQEEKVAVIFDDVFYLDWSYD